MWSVEDEQFLKVGYSFIDAGLIEKIGARTLCMYMVLRRFIWRSKKGILARFWKEGLLISSLRQKKIANLAGIQDRTVRRYLEKLKALGWISTMKVDDRDELVYVLGERIQSRDGEFEGELFYADSWCRSYISQKKKESKTLTDAKIALIPRRFSGTGEDLHLDAKTGEKMGENVQKSDESGVVERPDPIADPPGSRVLPPRISDPTGIENGIEKKKREAPSEARCATAPPIPPVDTGGEPESPLPSGPDGDGEEKDPRVSEMLGESASDCGDEKQGNWWAEEIMFSDTGKVPKKPKKSRKARKKTGASGKATVGGKGPPAPVWSLWKHFRMVVEDKWPEMNVPFKPVGREWANLKKMLQDYGEHDAHRIVDLAVADWFAIKETWPRVAQGAVTTFYAVFTLRADLMAAVASGSGVTTRSNRCSEYAAKVNADRPAQMGWGDLFDK